jgi:hypothetical protein
MRTEFVTVEVPLQDSPLALYGEIETTLGQWGEPLRWAIMAVDQPRGRVRVEAIVIKT